MSAPCAAMTAESVEIQSPNLVDELALERTPRGYARDISSFWSFGDDRVFGGYTVALGLAAAAQEVGMPALLSCQALFLNATRSGPTTFHVDVLSAGRATAMVRVRVEQDEQAILSVQALLCVEVLPSLGEAAVFVPPPQECPPLLFRMQAVPFMRFFEARTVDYPQDEASFHSGPAEVDLWVRPRKRLGQVTPLFSQLFDVMALDAHLLESARRARTSTRAHTASLDMSVMWQASIGLGAWRRVLTQSSAANHGFAATTGALHNEYGMAYVRAMQQGRVRLPSSAAVA